MATNYDDLFSNPLIYGQPQPQQNMLQGLNPVDPSQGPPSVANYGGYSPPAAAPVDPTQQPDNAMQAVDPAQAAPGDAPRKRLSLVDTIGRISDVLAKVGGAPEQYQPYLDQRIATQQQQQGNNLDMQAKREDIAQTAGQVQDGSNSRLSNYARAVQTAIKAGADPHSTMAGIAEQMGIPANVAAVFGHQYDQNPATLDAMASAGDPNGKEIYGTTPIWFTDGDGKRVLGQVSNKGNFKQVDANGLAPADTISANNAGDRLVYTAKHGDGMPVHSVIIQGKLGNDENANVDANGVRVGATPLPGSIGAAKMVNDATKTANDTTRTNTAANKATNGPAGKGGQPTSADIQAGLSTLDNIQQSFDRLHHMNALAGEDGLGLGRTAIGQTIGAHFGGAAAQERELLNKNLGTLQSDLLKSLPGNATRTRFEQEIQRKRLPDPMTMTYDTAKRAIQQYRDAYNTALQTAPSPAGRPTLSPLPKPKSPAGAPAGWKISVVQ